MFAHSDVVKLIKDLDFIWKLKDDMEDRDAWKWWYDSTRKKFRDKGYKVARKNGKHTAVYEG